MNDWWANLKVLEFFLELLYVVVISF
ncbi:hypothetical protein NC651_023349 [Populus alba x Populus x berolinensis]|nr:hypothetical protein NC651_022088 [Populus alba x Populus x berolinensis]KAJ6895767.1 hypothetical protein NC651_022103 [Populus alba x Populus x berolinensis]KAJ6897451.1 hypothetical protein NC651_023349 [Populus alba x Populus x berolinensis]